MGLSEDDLKGLIYGKTQHVLVWVGDQLTVEQIRGLIRYRHDNIN